MNTTAPGEILKQNRPKLRPVVFILVAIGVAAAVFAMVWRTAPDPQQMLDQAAYACETYPARGLPLVEASIQAAGGRFTEAQLVKCRLLVQLDRAEDAAKCFSAIADWPERERAKWLPRLEELVATEFELVEEKQALEHCEKFAQLAPESPIPWLISASIYHLNAQPLRALEAYRKAFARQPAPKEMLRISFQIVTLELHTGEIPAARKQLDYLLKLAEDTSLLSDGDAEGFQVLEATVLYREQAAAAALQLLDQFLAKSPNSLSALLLRGTIYLDQRKFDEAVNDLNDVVRLNPFESKAHYKLGQAYLGLKQTENAQSHLDKSHQLTLVQVKILQLQEEYFNDPTNRQLTAKLAELNDQLGDKKMADYWRRNANRTHSPAKLP